MMKKAFILLLSVSSLFTGCLPDENLPEEEPYPYPEEEEAPVELKLSVSGPVHTEDVDFEFEILDGNGGYTASASGDEDKDARVTVNGNKVTVNLLRSKAFVTVTDQRQQSAWIEINSSAELLMPHSYSLSMAVSDTLTLKGVTFGSGGYSVKKIKGVSAEATMIGNDHIRVTGLQPGTSYFKIIDRRGVISPFNVSVTTSCYLTNSSIEIAMVNDETAFVILQWGEGDWTLVEKPSSPVIENVWLMKKADPDQKYDVLQIDTSEGVANKGIATIHLKDGAGNQAVVTVRVQ